MGLPLLTQAQVAEDSTVSKPDQQLITVGGYIDVYYGYDFSEPASQDRAYFVSSARHNEFTLNLAFIDIKYTSDRIRATLRPALGTYMAANYSAEPAIFRNIYEGNVGVKLFRRKNIWLDAGVMGSPYTNESAISKDQLLYTRSFAPEYVPYYLSGIKVSMPLSNKVSLYLYLLNGWQNIRETNKGKSLGTQLEYKPSAKWLINWNTYLGDERSTILPENRTRYFSDIYAVFNPEGKVTATACLYMGAQKRVDSARGMAKETAYWYNANLMGRYRFTPSFSLSSRLEYFTDPDEVHISPITGEKGFRTYSASVCMNYAPAANILLRMEGRSFFSNKPVYQTSESTPIRTNTLLIASMAFSF
jgi:hypothetical protein